MSMGILRGAVRRLTGWSPVLGALVGGPTPALAQTACADIPLGVQVLGSGGPFSDGHRASTSYLVWRDGHAVVMIDAGGGTHLRFGEARARLGDLAFLGISHLHPDHVSDLPAMFWLSEQVRQRPLPIAGPSGTERWPAFDTFLARLFDAGTGAFPILAGTLGQNGQGVRLDPTVVDVAQGSPRELFTEGDLSVSGLGVPHANVPTVAYRIRAGGRTIVFGSDQNGTDERFVSFASGADILVMHLAVSQQAPDQLAQIHARPATVGQIAQTAGAKRLVLSHFILAPPTVAARLAFSLADLDGAVAEVRKAFAGPITVASDLLCIPIP